MVAEKSENSDLCVSSARQRSFKPQHKIVHLLGMSLAQEFSGKLTFCTVKIFS